MRDQQKKTIEYDINKQLKKRHHRLVVTFFALLVASCTFYALILPAITIVKNKMAAIPDPSLSIKGPRSGAHAQVDENGLLTTYENVYTLSTIDPTALDGQLYAIVSKTGMYIMTTSPNTDVSSELGFNGRQLYNSDIKSDVFSWLFEAVPDQEATYYLSSEGQYLAASKCCLTYADSKDTATAFKVTVTNDGSINLCGNGTYINLYGGEEYYKGKFACWNEPGGGSDLALAEWTVQESSYSPLTDTLTPTSSVINLFDYRVLTNPDGSWNENALMNNGANVGINEGHALQFYASNPTGLSKANANIWTGSQFDGGERGNGGALQGIVEDRLVDGYPVLSGNTELLSETEGDTRESLAYLFDPKIVDENKRVYQNVGKLFHLDNEGYYAFDSDERNAEFSEETYEFTQYPVRAVTWKLQYGQFFPFNDIVSSYGLDAGSDNLNHAFGLTLTTRFIQTRHGYMTEAKKNPTVFEFSGDDDVWIFIDNILVADLGGKHDAVHVNINFATGTVTIDKIYGQSEGQTRHFTEIFDAEDLASYEKDGQTYTTLKDNTVHTLKFFYLERGSNASNLQLKYNLKEVPPTEIYKGDQYEEPMSEVPFAVYPAYEDDAKKWWYTTEAKGTEKVCPDNVSENDITYDNDWNMYYKKEGTSVKIPALYHGKTNEEGFMTFVDSDQMPLSLDEIQDLFGDNFILREVNVPEGYRQLSSSICVKIEYGVLKVNGSYASGAYAQPKGMVTATNTIFSAKSSANLIKRLLQNDPSIDYIHDMGDGSYAIDFYDPEKGPKGTLFAVVLKRNGADKGVLDLGALNFKDWTPIWGNGKDEYTLVKHGAGTDYALQISAVIHAAQMQSKTSEVVFKLQASGMQLTFTDLPSTSERYTSYMLQNKIRPENDEDPQYLVAYYWTKGTLEDATDQNTVRVSSHDEALAEGYSGFAVQWAATIEIPNMENRLYFQKRKSEQEGGEYLTDAVFALYDVYEEGTTYYYKANDGTPIYLEVDENGDHTGKAGLNPGDTSFNYTIMGGSTKKDGFIIDENAGDIILKNAQGKTVYTISPATRPDDPADPVRNRRYVGYTHDNCATAPQAGTGHFYRMPDGCYILREIQAPPGYKVNPTEIRVLVNNDDVFANAGNRNNNVSVGHGLGYISHTLEIFATEGSINESLTWMTSALRVADNGDTPFSVPSFNSTEWKYAKKEEGDLPGYASGKTDKLSEAFVIYHKYDTEGENAIYDYIQNPDQSERILDGVHQTNAGENRQRLFTQEEGWSTLSAYQDYTYGHAQSALDEDTTYNDLRRYGDLANLFSTSTFVRMIDEHTDIDVTVTKKNDTEPVKYLDGASFKLYTLRTPRSSDVKYYYTLDEQGNVNWVEGDGTDAYVFTTATDESGDKKAYFTIPALSPGTYYLEEVEAPKGYHKMSGALRFQVGYYDAGATQEYGVIGDERLKISRMKKGDTYYDPKSLNIQYSLTVENTKSEVSIEVVKKGQYKSDTVDLSGAGFVFYTVAPDNTRSYYKSYNDKEMCIEWTADKDQAHVFLPKEGENKFIIDHLTDGVYHMEEVTVPLGYSAPLGEITITVDLKAQNQVTIQNTGDDAVMSSDVTNSSGTVRLYTFNVINLPLIDLPATGNTGVTPFTVTGLALIISSGICLGFRFKRKARRP